MELPNSFQPGDGLRLVTEGEGATKEAAAEQACRLAFTRLLMGRPGQVVLRSAHWEVSLHGLNKLLAKGELKPFVEAHSEFACQRVGSKMLITWAADAAPSSASAIVADSHSDGTWEEVTLRTSASIASRRAVSE